MSSEATSSPISPLSIDGGREENLRYPAVPDNFIDPAERGDSTALGKDSDSGTSWKQRKQGNTHRQTVVDLDDRHRKKCSQCRTNRFEPLITVNEALISLNHCDSDRRQRTKPVVVTMVKNANRQETSGILATHRTAQLLSCLSVVSWKVHKSSVETEVRISLSESWVGYTKSPLRY